MSNPMDKPQPKHNAIAIFIDGSTFRMSILNQERRAKIWAEAREFGYVTLCEQEFRVIVFDNFDPVVVIKYLLRDGGCVRLRGEEYVIPPPSRDTILEEIMDDDSRDLGFSDVYGDDDT